MKTYIKIMSIAGICLLLTSAALAETKHYINDSMTITMRTGPGTDRKIIALLGVGQEVEVMQSENEWTMVRLPSGKEGWVINRFITDQTPNAIQLKALQDKFNALQTKTAALIEENKTLSADNKKLGSNLTSNETKLKNLDSSYEALKRDSKHFLELQEKYKASATQLSEQTQKAQKYEDELTKLLWNKNIKWFLSGAGVLVLGFIIGFSTKRQRRHSSLL